MRLRFATNIIGTVLIIVFLIAGFNEIEFTQNQGLQEDDDIPEEEIASGEQSYGVSAAHPYAVDAGMKVLKEGGNAADAFIAVSFMLNVVEPYGSGIGGGGSLLYYDPQFGAAPQYLDYRETAPYNIPTAEQYGSSFGIPGFLIGMSTVFDNYASGNLSFADLLEPAIQIAEEGFEVDRYLAGRLVHAQYRMDPSQIPHFYEGAETIQSGGLLVQEELAETLRTIQEMGPRQYFLEVLAPAMEQRYPGLTVNDFQQYQVKQPEPVTGTFQGYSVYSAPAPLAGPTLIQLLQASEYLDLEEIKENENDDESWYLTYAELLSRVQIEAYNDRLQFIADPDFNQGNQWENPFLENLNRLTSEEYAQELAADAREGVVSEEMEDDAPAMTNNHNNTSHFVIVDKEGRMISVTHTLSNFFGSGQYFGGYFLNDQLSNFNQSPESINRYEPGKRPRSFMAPTILVSEEKGVLGMGSPGGARIPNMLAQTLIQKEIFDYGLKAAVEQPRFHFDDRIDRTGEIGVFVDYKFPSDWQVDLEARLNDREDIEGWIVQQDDSDMFFGGIQAMLIDTSNEILYGASDPRRGGKWEASDPEKEEEEDTDFFDQDDIQEEEGQYDE
ncbi:gamma-glutamyltransferase family protein [Alteribacter keqinensis]|uniref:Gamma-glutamyltransferase n=1 Tax=Alteribacter keqinensis TaxID=2483800 RepID=A0A3M7TS12_9BACI|nr:gamma-glutamyltransferase [Alteribacter keqinensis]RNA67780.1 gamma-glutamyltransferase [Alteribacter keqinensis]